MSPVLRIQADDQAERRVCPAIDAIDAVNWWSRSRTGASDRGARQASCRMRCDGSTNAHISARFAQRRELTGTVVFRSGQRNALMSVTMMIGSSALVMSISREAKPRR